MSFFCCNKINISRIKNDIQILSGISFALKKLSNSIAENKIMIGGDYHKKYYHAILEHYFDENYVVFNAKNTTLCEFLCDMKYNLCNYGLFFYKENGKIMLKIYSGNCVVLNKQQQNFIEKTLSNQTIFKENEKAIFSKYKNFYKVELLNFQLICKNKRLLKKIKKTNNKSNFKVIVLENLKYFVLYKNKKIKTEKIFPKFKKITKVDDDLIENLIKNNCYRVANKNNIVYNKSIYSFDILKTLTLISEKTNDNNFRKLVFKT